MTALRLADAGEAADLAAFLARLIHYDRAAAVRLQAGDGVLAVFGRPPSFEVLAIRTARLAPAAPGTLPETAPGSVSGALPGPASETAPGALPGSASETAPGALPGPTPETAPGAGLDLTVSAGDLLEGIDESTDSLALPAPVTGPPWTGVLPPRGGWQQVPGLPSPQALGRTVALAVAEFRARDEALPPERRTRAERDRIGREIWSRTLGDTHLPLRAAHAAQSLGFLRPVRAEAQAAGHGPAGTGHAAWAALAEPPTLTLLAAGGWLRLRTPYGSVAVRTGGMSALPVMPA
ncbi:hypothetical protein CP973_07595 [Streptomyces albofaciens JCM 4342]|uniref:hypothetical protein n=1 Tax=Streptomyces albofaciens TaxID=66866 RepID=UPI001238F93A|nr:hypothetical protein [Streptomyces albofaciens]KAA6221843.1 hypothetical protein CP973_07595 [Streptomyces albofaciens JCM 4342]